MIQAEVHFMDQRTPVVLPGVMTVKVLNDEITWKYLGKDGPATFVTQIAEVDYVRLGNQ